MKKYNKILEAINRGIKLALDDFEDDIQDQEPILSKKKVQNYDAEEDMWLFENTIDLGLPSGTLWAKYNVGCDWDKLNNNPKHTKPKDWYGNFYAWGETTDKINYAWTEYKYAKWEGCYPYITKYSIINNSDDNSFEDKLKNLELSDDVAYKFNNRFLMPTQEQFKELLKYCIYFQQADYNKIKGLNGIVFISNINGNKLFFPFAGNMNLLPKAEEPGSNYANEGTRCWYWSNTLGRSNLNGTALSISNDVNEYGGAIHMCGASRASGHNVRGVLRK